MKKAILFDLDGTLLESMSIWSNLCNEFLRRHGIDEDVDLDGKLGVLSIRKLADGALYAEMTRKF